MVTKAGDADLPAKGPGLGMAIRYAPRNVYNTAASFMTKGCQQTKPPTAPTENGANRALPPGVPTRERGGSESARSLHPC